MATRTYSSRNRKSFKSEAYTSSSPPSTLASSPPATPAIVRPSKRPISHLLSFLGNENDISPPLKRLKSLAKPTTAKTKSKSNGKVKNSTQNTLTQLHFNIDQPILRTCSLCDLSYTKGAPDDEILHRTHCSRVRQGMEWGRGEEKDSAKSCENIVEIETNIKLKSKSNRGRIICLPANVGGKPRAKLATLLQTINLSLSAPELSQSILNSSKAYLFLLPHETQPHREHIVGCLLAQRIETAMAIVPSPSSHHSENPDVTSPTKQDSHAPILVDTTTNLCCSPTPLPTPMGVSRLFVSSSHRRLGIARALLDAAAGTFIYGCRLDPCKGQVAFSQPTGMGQAVMKSWGSTRVYEA